MPYKLNGNGFTNYTGMIGKTEFVDGIVDEIPDRMDVDMISITLGMSKMEAEIQDEED